MVTCASPGAGPWAARMSILDQHRQQRERKTRRASGRRIDSPSEGHITTSGTWAPVERRRPNRGTFLNTPNPRDHERLSHAGRGVAWGDWVRWAGRGLLILLLVPVQFLILASRPRDLLARFRQAPARFHEQARRLRVQSRDRDTPAGQVIEGMRASMHFVDEELRDMRGGFPSAEELAECLILWTGRARFRLHAGARMVLDVPGRSAEAVVTGFLIWALGFGLFVAAHGAAVALDASPALALHRVDVEGTVRLSEAEVRRSLSLPPGSNLLQIDRPSLTARLLRHPWIRSAELRVDLPDHRILVTITEHRPELLLAGAPVRLVDDEGVAFKELAPGDPVDLPVLTGLSEGSTAADVALVAVVSRGARELLATLDQGHLFRRESVAEVHWDGDDGYTLVSRDGLPIKAGRSEFGQRLSRLERALQKGQLPLHAVAMVDLSLRDRMVVLPRPGALARKLPAPRSSVP